MVVDFDATWKNAVKRLS